MAKNTGIISRANEGYLAFCLGKVFQLRKQVLINALDPNIFFISLYDFDGLKPFLMSLFSLGYGRNLGRLAGSSPFVVETLNIELSSLRHRRFLTLPA